MPKIAISELSISYGSVQALKKVSLAIEENEIYALLGPARSGKTTLLRALNRLGDLVTGTRVSGQVLLDGADIYSDRVDVEDLRRRVGMVFDLPVALPMSIFDNVAYGPRLRPKGGKLDETVERALRGAALWEEVKDRLRAPARGLSGGQQQRLCIARMLALEPEVLLLDQPCSGLDPISTLKIEQSLKELKDSYTIVIVPHNVQQAARIADHVGFLLMGEMVEQGTATDIFASPRDQRTSDYITGRFG
ncbi:MAG: phosphate ABC transporter ATP-binding protein [Chloroflexi bacterium]|nr:phosphate ABC transporter ATP-binding protein [Chloroflexota bacterium]